jgi:nucleoside-diphosphate-sugar epimerase
VWIDESLAPLEPRNIYGVTKYAAEKLCRLFHAEHGLPIVILRTSRFFPEDDDTHALPSGPNMKANEFLYRRLTVEDAARVHLVALEKAAEVGIGTYIISAPTPFRPEEAEELKRDAAAVLLRHFPQARTLYAEKGWVLPATIGRVYDSSLAERELGFRCETDFAAVLRSIQDDGPLPFVHDAAYLSPKERA